MSEDIIIDEWDKEDLEDEFPDEEVEDFEEW